MSTPDPAVEGRARADEFLRLLDAGTAIGALVPGFVAAAVGLPWTYALVAAVLVAALPVARVATRLS